MKRRRYSLLTLFLIVSLAGLAFTPVNQRTGIQIWHMLNPASVPPGGLFIDGGVRREIPYFYGDTWFARYARFKQSFYPSRNMLVAPRIIIDDEEEPLLLQQTEVQQPRPQAVTTAE